LKGSSTGQIVIENLTPDERIKPGEKVLTSGGDMVFPRGLAVGTVESIKLDPDHQPYTLITLKPAANLNQLEEVLVVTATGNSLDPKTEQELAADAAANAADVSAERLPSLHEKGDAGDNPNGDADATPPPDNSTQLVPKPKPVIHPDKYSPGSAPPASELQPGGGTSAPPPPAQPPQ
jgi:rod shape-determining protein MreC